MKNKLKLLGIIAAVAVIGFSATGCATNTSVVNPGWNQQLMFPCGEHVRDYTILGIVQVEETRTHILGGGFPNLFTGGFRVFSLLRFTSGEATYANILAEARRQFPHANAVTNVQIDRVHRTAFIFVYTVRYTLTGLAVEFASEPSRD